MSRRRDFRRNVKGYLDAATDGSVDAGRGLGSSTERGGDASESNKGKKL